MNFEEIDFGNEARDFDAFAQIKSSDSSEVLKLWLKIRRDSQIPSFDVIEGGAWSAKGFETSRRFNEKVLEMVSEFGGMFVDDVLRLEESDVASVLGMESGASGGASGAEWGTDSGENFSVPALKALKKAIYDYFLSSGQQERYERATTRLICRCKHVTDKDLKEAVVKRGCKSFEEVSKFTGAGTGCGSCAVVAGDLVETYLGEMG